MYVVALCLIFTQIVIIPTALSHSQLCSLSLFDPIQELTIHGKNALNAQRMLLIVQYTSISELCSLNMGRKKSGKVSVHSVQRKIKGMKN